MKFASTTTVSVEKSRAELEALLRRYKASAFASGWDPTHDRIEFEVSGRRIRFVLPRPDRNAKKYRLDGRGFSRTQKAIDMAVAQADRQRWRALLLVVKAKLEAVESGIAVFEQEFMAFIVDPVSDMTVGDMLVPRLMSGEPLRALLPAAGGGQ